MSDRRLDSVVQALDYEGDAEGLHVLIVGAGTIGLLIAQGLKKAGIRASVFEAEPNARYYRDREWGTSIQWALPMLDQLLPDDLLKRVQSTAVDPRVESPEYGMPVYNAESGENMKQVPLPRFIRVSRHKFRTLCAEGIDVQYGKRLASASATDSGVTLQFIDNTSATGTLLIGSDGARSTARSLIYGPSVGAATPIPFKAINMHVNYNSASTSLLLRKSFVQNSLMAIGFHPRGYWLWVSIQEVPDDSDPATWVFQLQWTWPHSQHSTISPGAAVTDKVTLEQLQKVAAECFGEPWRTAWMAIPQGTPVFENNISTWTPVPVPSESEFKGRFVLAGDAAHAMSFHRGQGLNHGIADAVKITECLKVVQESKMGLEEAVQEYWDEMVKRAGEEVTMGKRNTEMVHDWEKVMESPFVRIGGARKSVE